MARRIFKAATIAATLALAARAAAPYAGQSPLSLTIATAHAGQYHVYSCRTPAGESAPTDGWSGSVAAGGAFDDYALNTCVEGGALVAALGDQTIHGAEIDKATWGFASPADASLSSATLWRAGYVRGQSSETATYQLWMTGPNENLAFDECIFTLGCPREGSFSTVFSPENRVSVPAGSLGARLFVNANCGVIPGHICERNAGDPNGYAAAIYVYAADLILEENAAPHATNAAGDLASAPTVQGQSDLSFDATDAGSGVFEAMFSVDGHVVQRTVVDSNGGRCRDVGQTTDGLAAFLYVQPCAPAVSVDVPFDTTKVANGAHHLLVSVIDAAGNAAPVLDRSVTIANPPAPGAANGTNASAQATLSVRWTGTRKASLMAGFGGRETLTGQLKGPGGVPIAGAAIDLRVTPAYAGARPQQISNLQTGPDGRFGLRIVGGASSRTLRFAYRAHVGDALPVATRTLALQVRAGIALSVSPRTTSVGRSIVFSGRLRGGPIPRGGKQLVLEAHSLGSPWIEFKVVRTDARGRYRAAYRFKFSGPADYRFRARSEPESDFPFAGGSSNVVAVHER
jgi:hypothetical protein